MIAIIDIEIYDLAQENAQARYLVHGYDDVYWVDDIKEVVEVIKKELNKIT